jgi:large subunit ribosomal protein L31e
MANLERIYTIPLGDAYLRVRNKRAKRAIAFVRAFALRHMKASEVGISQGTNSLVFRDGMQKPPRRIKVRIVKADDGHAKVWLIGEEEKIKAEEEKKKKETPKKEAPKASEKKDAAIEGKIVPSSASTASKAPPAAPAASASPTPAVSKPVSTASGNTGAPAAKQAPSAPSAGATANKPSSNQDKIAAGTNAKK